MVIGYSILLMFQDRKIFSFHTSLIINLIQNYSGKGKTVAPLVGTTLPLAQRNITEFGFQIASQKSVTNIDAAEYEY